MVEFTVHGSDRAAVRRVFEPMMTMKNIDVASMESAYRGVAGASRR